MLNIYRRIEDWDGFRDPDYRGSGGPVYVRPAADPESARPGDSGRCPCAWHSHVREPRTVSCWNGKGASIVELRARDGHRQSVFRIPCSPRLDRPISPFSRCAGDPGDVQRTRVNGVEFTYDGSTHGVAAGCEVVSSLGAIHTPKLLMQSGVGDAR